MELKPCPFCGNEHPKITVIHGCSFMIECPQCNIHFRTGPGERDGRLDRVTEAWNRRAE